MQRSAKPTRDLALLTVAALIVRLCWVWSSAWLAGDSNGYLSIARNLVFNHVFSGGDATKGTLLPTAHRSPLYPALIALLWWGEAPPIIAVMLLQCVLGAGTVALVYLIARDRFSRKVALIAGAGMVFAPMTGYFTATILTETVFTFLLTLAIFLWGREKSILSGLAFGLAALARSELLYFLFLIPVLALLLPAWRPKWRTHLTIFIVAIGVSTIWIARNAVVFKQFIPIAASGSGMSLLCGTIETEIIGIKVWTGSEYALMETSTHPVLQVDPALSEKEQNRLLFERGFQRIADDPLHWLAVRAKQYPKLFLDSGNYVLGSRNISIREAMAQSRYGVLLVKGIFLAGNLLVIAVAGFGLFAERKRLAALIHIIAFPIFLLLVYLPMWIESRYSLPIMPMVAIFFAAGALRLIEDARHAIDSARGRARREGASGQGELSHGRLP